MRSIEAFLDQGWYDYDYEAETSLLIFYSLYESWCQGEELKALSGEEFFEELEDFGIIRTNETHVRGVYLNERGTNIALQAIRVFQFLEGLDEEHESNDKDEAEVNLFF